MQENKTAREGHGVVVGEYFFHGQDDDGKETKEVVMIKGYPGEEEEDGLYGFFEAIYAKSGVVLNEAQSLSKYPSYNRVWQLLYNYLEREAAREQILATVQKPVEVPADAAITAIKEAR